MKTIPAMALGCLLVALSLLTACATMMPGFTQPQVKVAGLRLLPASEGELAPRLGVRVIVSNPNDVDLSVTGMSYSIALDGYNLLSGVRGDLPAFKAFSETPLELTLSADMLQMLKLVRALAERHQSKPIEYEFNARLSTGRLRPAIHLKESGQVTFDSLSKGP